MANSLTLGADGQANHTLDVWRQQTSEGTLNAHLEFLPGLNMHLDPEMDLQGTFRSPKGRLFEFEAQTAKPGRWVGLHVALPAHDLHHVGIVGFGARINAGSVYVARACLRSSTPDGFVDCFFDKHLLFRPEEASHIDAISVAHRDNVPIQATWRELILFLPTESFQLSVIDLRLFVV